MLPACGVPGMQLVTGLFTAADTADQRVSWYSSALLVDGLEELGCCQRCVINACDNPT